MKYKLDENLPRDLVALFRDSGHDAVTVLDQGLSGASDFRLASICVSEDRAIVFLRVVQDTDLQGQLWIVEETRIRVRD
ncbi:DUF5615 family PIN-like protein [Candidatus Palauibacter sp.]|uniref:DUF5615 family PIN-like protein n=1 Tax=Candidatus Palauibacter sp. TaxID=3101350 RepID=UPI003B599049